MNNGEIITPINERITLIQRAAGLTFGTDAYLLGAFVVRMILPWAFDNWGNGGTAVVCRRKDTVSRVVTRVFALIIVLLAVWQLSYGVLWETEFLMIIAVAITSMEPLLKQNLYFENSEEKIAPEEDDKQEDNNKQEKENNTQEKEKNTRRECNWLT